MMKTIYRYAGNLAYAAALGIAAASGSILALSGTAHAQGSAGVTLSSEALIERLEKNADGSEKRTYKTPNEVSVTPGDMVLFKLHFENRGAEPAEGFTATNPLPKPVQFVESGEDWAEVSVDGGKSWGQLSALTVTENIKEPARYDAASGAKIADAVDKMVTRQASAADVTHVRWAFKTAVAPGAKGYVSYRGRVK